MTPARRRQLARLEWLYAEPDALTSYEAWQRRIHADLSTFTLGDLLLDQERLRLRLVFDPDPRAWFLERARALNEALRRAA